MKAIDTSNHFCSTIKFMMNNDIEDDESTVSYYDDDFLTERNPSGDRSTEHRRSFASATSNDDSTVITVASTINDNFSYLSDDYDLSDGFDDESVLITNESYDISSQPHVKHVKFGNSTVREYGLTVAACTPANTGTCPITLTWDYDEPYTVETKQNDRPSVHRQNRPRLSASDRRQRIAVVQGISNADVIKLEYETSLSLIEETLVHIEKSRHKILHSLELSPPVYHYSTDSNFSSQITGESNTILRKIMLEEISFIPL